MLAEFRTGPIIAQDGAVNPVRTGRFGEAITGAAVGKYYELAKQGRLFLASFNSGIALGAALPAGSANTPGITLYNPLGSGVNLVILAGGLTITTHAAGATTQQFAWVAQPNTAALVAAVPTTVTALTIRPVLIGSGFTSAARAYSAAVFVPAPVIVRVFPAAHVQTAAVTTVGGSNVDYVDGALSLLQNTAISITGVGGTAMTGICSLVWAEIPV